MGYAANPPNAADFARADHTSQTPAEPTSYAELNRLTGALIETRKAFDDDLDLFLFQLVLQLDRIAPTRGLRLQRGVNALSVAEITGVPRETARRKLLALAARGQVVKLPDNLYYAAGPSPDVLGCVRAITGRKPAPSLEDEPGWVSP